MSGVNLWPLSAGRGSNKCDAVLWVAQCEIRGTLLNFMASSRSVGNKAVWNEPQTTLGLNKALMSDKTHWDVFLEMGWRWVGFTPTYFTDISKHIVFFRPFGYCFGRKLKYCWCYLSIVSKVFTKEYILTLLCYNIGYVWKRTTHIMNAIYSICIILCAVCKFPVWTEYLTDLLHFSKWAVYNAALYTVSHNDCVQFDLSLWWINRK